MTPTGFPHSDIHGSKVARHLPAAYRSLLRPSSVFRVKASLVCAYVTFYEFEFTEVNPKVQLTSYWYNQNFAVCLKSQNICKLLRYQLKTIPSNICLAAHVT
jgi:hypothetical protein